VPTGAAASERSIPTGLLVLADELPKREIACVFLFVLVGIDTFAAAGDITGEVYLRKLAVFWKRGDAVIDRAV